jgi:hypothetical protein
MDKNALVLGSTVVERSESAGGKFAIVWVAEQDEARLPRGGGSFGTFNGIEFKSEMHPEYYKPSNQLYIMGSDRSQDEKIYFRNIVGL